MELEKEIPDYVNLDKPEFNKKGRVHDWRNHIPDGFMENWDKLTLREKQIIYIMCENQADNEEWD